MASMLEVVELIAEGRCVVLTIIDVPDGAVFFGDVVTGMTALLQLTILNTTV